MILGQLIAKYAASFNPPSNTTLNSNPTPIGVAVKREQMPPPYAETSEEIIVYLTDNDTDIVKAGLIDLVHHAASTGKRVNLDVHELQLLTSPILGMLITLRKRARDIDVDFGLVNVGPDILEQFATIQRTLDDDGSDMLGAGVPRPKPPSTDGGRAERHED